MSRDQDQWVGIRISESGSGSVSQDRDLLVGIGISESGSVSQD